MTVYLDHNASSPLHADVLEAMMPFLRQPVGNPSSLHSMGRMARSAIESARESVAELIHCDSADIIFTSGGTEANNLLLKGYVDRGDSRAVISTPIEHPSLIEPLKQLQREGVHCEWLPVEPTGRVAPEPARRRIEALDPQILTVIYANNETGVIQPVAELAARVDSQRCLTHSDITQAIGKLDVDLGADGLQAASFSAHKIKGPQGVGALVVRGQPRNTLIAGGYQEHRRRGGTENLAGIVGLGAAARLARVEMRERRQHLESLQRAFEARLDAIPGSCIFGRDVPRLANTTFFALPYYHGETLLMELDRAGFAVASGSACHSAVTEPSHVLKAMGIDDALALNAIRVSFGPENSLQDVDGLIAELERLVAAMPAVIHQAAG